MFRSVSRKDDQSGGAVVAFLIGCLTGIVCGSTLGVLWAPHSGRITRRKLGRKLGEAKDQADERLADMKSRAAGVGA